MSVVCLGAELSPKQVNADIRTYTVKDSGENVLTRVNTSHVGKNISTKAVGRSAVNIITNEYKFKEGSASERAALLGTSPFFLARCKPLSPPPSCSL